MLKAPSASHQQLMPKLMEAADLLQNQEIAKRSASQVKALLKEALAVLEQADDLPREPRDRTLAALTELHTNFGRENGLTRCLLVPSVTLTISPCRKAQALLGCRNVSINNAEPPEALGLRRWSSTCRCR